MGTKIQGRKESVILRELTMILSREMKNEILKGVSISEVRLSSNGENAKIFYSYLALNPNITSEKVANELKKQNKSIRMKLASKIDRRVVPELTFVYDVSLDNAARIDEILKNIK